MSSQTDRQVIGEQHTQVTSPDSFGLESLPTDVPTTNVVGWSLHALTNEYEKRTDGELREVLASSLNVPTDSFALLDRQSLLQAVQSIRSLVLKNQFLTVEATIDELTHALRRGAGLSALQRELNRYSRKGGRGVVVMFIDVDGLKQVNDTIGHTAGDTLLQTVVAVVTKHLRSYDVIFRYGGDEFVCILSEATITDARKRIAMIQEHIASDTAGSTISIGLATARQTDTVDHIIARADADLYTHRRTARTTIYDPKQT